MLRTLHKMELGSICFWCLQCPRLPMSTMRANPHPKDKQEGNVRLSELTKGNDKSRNILQLIQIMMHFSDSEAEQKKEQALLISFRFILLKSLRVQTAWASP